jgi:hypothetical protein
VAHLIQQTTAAGHSLGVDCHGKGPLEIARTPDLSAEESGEGTDVDAYLNTAMFTTQPLRKL